EVARRFIQHPRALQHHYVIRLFFQNLRDELGPVVAASKILLVEPDLDAAGLELRAKAFGRRLVPVFIAQEYHWSIVGRLRHGRRDTRRGLLFEPLAQLACEVLPGKLPEVDEMATLKEYHGLPLVRKSEKISILQRPRRRLVPTSF